MDKGANQNIVAAGEQVVGVTVNAMVHYAAKTSEVFRLALQVHISFRKLVLLSELFIHAVSLVDRSFFNLVHSVTPFSRFLVYFLDVCLQEGKNTHFFVSNFFDLSLGSCLAFQ